MLKLSGNRKLILFFVLAYALSWICWIPIALTGRDANTSHIRPLFYAGILGPFLAGVLLVFFTEDKQVWANYWARLIDFRHIRPSWYLVIFGIYPALYLIALFVDGYVFGHQQTLSTARKLLAAPLSIAPYSFLVLLLGPLPEELGWRGYALERLQERCSALNASLILGGMWAIWHSPLFFIYGSDQHTRGVGSPSFWFFVAAAVLTSVLFTWIYNSNNRSTLSAVLFHFVLNYTEILFRTSESVERLQLFLLALFVFLVVFLWTPQSLQNYRGFSIRTRDRWG